MKDGDRLLEQLRQAVKKQDDMGLFVFAVRYDPPWWYWEDFTRGNKN